jgi:hypothetical protein
MLPDVPFLDGLDHDRSMWTRAHCRLVADELGLCTISPMHDPVRWPPERPHAITRACRWAWSWASVLADVAVIGMAVVAFTVTTVAHAVAARVTGRAGKHGDWN